jgi:methylglutaconyl-CoA hydratase
MRGARWRSAATTLRALKDTYEVPLALGLELGCVRYDETRSSDDRLEALRAFAEKRKPSCRRC